MLCFNTQPHGGGCQCKAYHAHDKGSFNTQPHGGGCSHFSQKAVLVFLFQHTAARRRLPSTYSHHIAINSVSTHSRTEAAAWVVFWNFTPFCVSTHSRTEAAALFLPVLTLGYFGFNTQPHGGGCSVFTSFNARLFWFQHTAARRRLLLKV